MDGCVQRLCITLTHSFANLKDFYTSHVCFPPHQFNPRCSFKTAPLGVIAAETHKPSETKWKEAHAVRQSGGASPLWRGVTSALVPQMWTRHFDFPGKLTDGARRSPSNGAMGVGLKETSPPVEAQRRRGNICASRDGSKNIRSTHQTWERKKKKKWPVRPEVSNCPCRRRLLCSSAV